MKNLMKMMTVAAATLALTGCVGVSFERDLSSVVNMGVTAGPAVPAGGVTVTREYANEGWDRLFITWRDGGGVIGTAPTQMLSNIDVWISPYNRPTTFEIDGMHSEHVAVIQNGRDLEIRFDGTVLDLRNALRIEVGTDQISYIRNVLGNVLSDGTLRGDELTIRSTGLGDTHLELAVNVVDVETTGLGNVILSGTAEEVIVNAVGMGNLELARLIAREVTVTKTGMGAVEVHATERFTSRATGMGSVIYYGNPPYTNINNTGMVSTQSR